MPALSLITWIRRQHVGFEAKAILAVSMVAACELEYSTVMTANSIANGASFALADRLSNFDVSYRQAGSSNLTQGGGGGASASVRASFSAACRSRSAATWRPTSVRQ